MLPTLRQPCGQGLLHAAGGILFAGAGVRCALVSLAPFLLSAHRTRGIDGPRAAVRLGIAPFLLGVGSINID